MCHLKHGHERIRDATATHYCEHAHGFIDKWCLAAVVSSFSIMKQSSIRKPTKFEEQRRLRVHELILCRFAHSPLVYVMSSYNLVVTPRDLAGKGARQNGKSLF